MTLIFIVDSKSLRASNLHYWFINYDNFAGICRVESKDHSILRHLVNCNLALESQTISTSRHQTPDKGIGIIWFTCGAQELLKKLLQSINSGLNRHIDILTYQYQYAKCRRVYCKYFGASRGAVVFFNNDISIAGESSHTKDGEVYWQPLSFLLSGRIEGCRTHVFFVYCKQIIRR